MKAFGTATQIGGRCLILAVSLTLFVCLPTSAQIGKKGQVNPQPPADASKTTAPARKKTTTKTTSSAGRSRGNASPATNTTGSTGSNKSLTQTLTLIKKSFESERPLPAAEGPVISKNETFEFDNCLIRTKNSLKGDAEGSYLMTETFDLTDIDPASINVSQYGEFERKSFMVNFKTLNDEEKIKGNWKYTSRSDFEQLRNDSYFNFKEKATADRVAIALEQAVTLCKSQ